MNINAIPDNNNILLSMTNMNPNIDPLEHAIYVNEISHMFEENSQQQEINTNKLANVRLSGQTYFEIAHNMPHHVQPGHNQIDHDIKTEIIEQPQDDHDYKFRYENEKQHAAPILGRQKQNLGSGKGEGKGQNNTRPYPAIQITNAPAGPAVVWIQCVEADYDPNGNDKPKANPNCLFLKKTKTQHGLEGIAIISDGEKDGQHTGVVKLHINDLSQNNGKIVFKGAIQLALFRTRNDDIWRYLSARNSVNSNTLDGIEGIESIKIPIDTKSKDAKRRLKTEMNTKRIKLCFQVFLCPKPDVQPNVFASLAPVCSTVILDKHANPPLQIDGLRPNKSPETGLEKVILLCNKIEEQKDDENKINILFIFKDDEGKEIRSEGTFQASDVHHQVAITFKPPEFPQKLRNTGSSCHAHAKVQLSRSTEGKEELSNPEDFIYFSSNNVGKPGKCIGAWKNETCKYKADEDSTPVILKPLPPISTLQKIKGRGNQFKEINLYSNYTIGSILPATPVQTIQKKESQEDERKMGVITVKQLSQELKGNQLKEFKLSSAYSLGSVLPAESITAKRPHGNVGRTGHTDPDLNSQNIVEKHPYKATTTGTADTIRTGPVISGVLDIQEEIRIKKEPKS